MVNCNIICTLYHAKWCGHCVNFKPEWKLLQQQINRNSNIILEEFEEQQLGGNVQALINGKPIRGFPTLKIKITSGNKSVEYEYEGKRKAQSILHHLQNDAIDNLKKIL